MHIYVWGDFFVLIIKFRTVIFYITVILLTICGAYIFLGHAEQEETEPQIHLPIIMYHAICDDSSLAGKFVITKDSLEKDLKYISENGYTTISSKELIDYAENGTPLPEKPIMLTFDDGYFNNYCYAYPLLKEYNMKAIISIIGKYTDLYSETTEENPRYSHITWSQAQEMCNSGLVEIQNHSYNSHTTDKGRNGTKKKTGESAEAYAEYIYSDVGKLQSEITRNLGYTPTVFAYPFGSVSEASYDILKGMGFKITLGCEEKVNVVKYGESDGLYMLGRYLRTNKRSVEEILR